MSFFSRLDFNNKINLVTSRQPAKHKEIVMANQIPTGPTPHTIPNK